MLAIYEKYINVNAIAFKVFRKPPVTPVIES